MIYNKTDALEAVINMSIADLDPDELGELIGKLSNDEDPIVTFCERFDLGDWFIESLADFDIIDILERIKTEWDKECREAADFEQEVNRDLQLANGWPA